MRFLNHSWLLAAWRCVMARLFCVAALASVSGIPAAAQVFEITGGASSLFQAEGGSLHVYGGSYSARFDVGVSGAPRAGFLLEIPIRSLSWGLGDQTFSFSLPA